MGSADEVPVSTGAVVKTVRGWPVWALPRPLCGYIGAVVALAAGLTVLGLLSTTLRAGQLATWLALLACAALCLEVHRRVGEPAGMAKDLLSVWTLPIALLLPPVYALLAPVPLTAIKQLRGRSGLLHRRVFSVAAIGLEGALRSWLFHLMVGPLTLATLLRSPALVVAVGLGCGALAAQVNTMLIAMAVRLSSPELPWRGLLWNRESLVLDAGELTAGVLVAAGWVVSPVLALVMLPTALLLHRSLMHAQLRAAARVDAKTGLLNAATWQEEAEREIVRAGRHRQPLAVLLIDIDHFKHVNDSHGHLAGDEVLAAVSAALREAVRGYDVLGRFGGEEFTALLPHTDQAEAELTADRLRHYVADHPILLAAGPSVRVTVSVGAAALGAHGVDLTDLLTAADVALYRAKAAGRNRVSFAAGGSTLVPGRGVAARSIR
jgi:diguanylate cyclase (GGDEF)-like protein